MLGEEPRTLDYEAESLLTAQFDAKPFRVLPADSAALFLTPPCNLQSPSTPRSPLFELLARASQSRQASLIIGAAWRPLPCQQHDSLSPPAISRSTAWSHDATKHARDIEECEMRSCLPRTNQQTHIFIHSIQSKE